MGYLYPLCSSAQDIEEYHDSPVRLIGTYRQRMVDKGRRKFPI